MCKKESQKTKFLQIKSSFQSCLHQYTNNMIPYLEFKNKMKQNCDEIFELMDMFHDKSE
jgi:hypothetical protein